MPGTVVNSKSAARKGLRVQVSSPAHTKSLGNSDAERVGVGAWHAYGRGAASIAADAAFGVNVRQ
jgi:hypothetical protein